MTPVDTVLVILFCFDNGCHVENIVTNDIEVCEELRVKLIKERKDNTTSFICATKSRPTTKGTL